MIPLFRLHRRSVKEQDESRAVRANGIRGVLKVSGIIFLVLVAFLVSMVLLTPFLKLYSLKQEKEHVEVQLHHAKEEEEEARNRLLWAQGDAEYYEQIARDRANQAKEGEHVIRRPADEDEPQPTAPKRD